jgi:PKD repeat protein
MMDYGESNMLSLTVENVGIEAATGVEVSISTDDEYITITDDTEVYGDIEANTTAVVEDGFAYDVANDLPDGHSVTFEVSATDGTDVWVSYISITGYAPVLEFAGFSISDPTGNNNGKLDPGETADITVEIENDGSSEAFAIIGNLLESDPFLTVNTEDVEFGDLMSGNTASGVFSVYAEETTPAGHMVDLDFEMAADLGIEGMGAFNVVIGQIPLLIIDMDGNGNSAQGMEEALSDMEISYEVSSSLPPDLNLYSTIFLTLGIYSNNHVLSSGEGSSLADYLNAGGNLYMEGGDTWYYDNSTAVHSMFGINGTSDGSGDLCTINGQAGTITEDMSFSYTGDNNWIDHLEATGTGEVIFMNQSPSYGTAISNDAGDYKTIGASHEFGGLSDGSSPSTKAELMGKYLEFFGLTGGTQVLTAIFTSDETEICAEESVAFSDLSLGSPSSWSWTFEGGSPETSSAQNPTVMYFIAGSYDVTLEVSDGMETVSITMEDYITVNAAPAQATTPEGEAEICTNFLAGPVEYTTAGADDAVNYVWELSPAEAGMIEGDGLTANVTFTENWIGTAMIKVKGVNDCGEGEFSETFEVLCDICESIDESMLRNSLSIYPNPTNGEFTVEFNMNIGTTQVEVVNLLNQVVYSNNVDVNTNTTLKVDLSSVGDGIYFVRIKAQNSESIRKVVVR